MLSKCNTVLKKWLLSPKERMNIYENMNLNLFDVSLRDGLQCLDESYHHLYSISEKKRLYYNIKWNYKPTNIEIGTLTSPKIMPIMKDSLELFKEIQEEQGFFEDSNFNMRENHYMVIPNKKKLEIAIQNGVKCFSLLTSVSNSFQKRNVNMNISETQKELEDIFTILNSNLKDYKTKLYISCINSCPIEGNINYDFIINEILKYNKKFNIDLICLSDTCGTLTFNDYEYIIDKCIYFGLPVSKICLHLHLNADDSKQFLNAKKIILHSFDKKIKNFDVSEIEYGGCSATMNKENLRPNLKYSTFYEILSEYIEEKNS
jgi:isopropylmalate/homocitrate/citramalate synthase